MNIARYKWPVIIAAGLHGALFVSFPPPDVDRVVVVAPKPDRLPEIPVVLEPPADPETGGAGGGEPVPTLADAPSPPDLKAPFEMPVVERSAPDRPVPDLKTPPGPGDGENIFDMGRVKAPSIASPGNLDRVPRTVVQTAPRYPSALRNDGIDGEAVVEFIVGTDGRVLTAEAVRSTHREFASAAVDAVLRWKFEPGTINGRPVRFRMAIPVQFSVAR